MLQGLVDHNINCLKGKIEAIFKLREERDNQNKDGSDAVDGAVGGTAASVGAAANSYRDDCRRPTFSTLPRSFNGACLNLR